VAIDATVSVTPERRDANLPPNHQIATTQYIKGTHQTQHYEKYTCFDANLLISGCPLLCRNYFPTLLRSSS